MQTDYVTLSSVPINEEASQLGWPDFGVLVRLECRVFIWQIERQLGPVPQGAKLYTHREPYDGDPYYEVAVRYDEDDDTAREWAYRCEEEIPTEWDAEARAELAEAGYFEKMAANASASRIPLYR